MLQVEIAASDEVLMASHFRTLQWIPLLGSLESSCDVRAEYADV
jgi:hypothetical protein